MVLRVLLDVVVPLLLLPVAVELGLIAVVCKLLVVSLIAELVAPGVVVPVVCVAVHGELIVEVVGVRVVGRLALRVEIRHDVVELLQIAVVCLLSDILRVGRAVASGQAGSLSHRVLHGLLPQLGVLVPVLLIEAVRVQVKPVRLAVSDPADGVVHRVRPRRRKLRLLRVALELFVPVIGCHLYPSLSRLRGRLGLLPRLFHVSVLLDRFALLVCLPDL